LLSNLLSAVSWLVCLLSGLGVVLIGASTEGGRDGGRALAMMMLAPVFAGSLLSAFGLALWRGGMDWVASGSAAWRGWAVMAAVLAAAVVACFCAAVRLESAGQTPWALWPLRAWAHWVWPPVLVAGAALTLWPGLGDRVPALAWRVPLAVVGGVSLVICAGLLVQLMQSTIASEHARVDEAIAFDERRDRMVMAEVERADPVRDFVSLMNQTSHWEKPGIRAAALAKVNAHPDLDGALSALLRSDQRDYAFTYLASNDPPNPAALLAPLREAFAATPSQLQREIADNRALRADETAPQVRRLLAVADKFEPLGLDPNPMAAALSAVLDAPRASNIRLESRALLDAWLAGRQRAKQPNFGK
jgi:hypothetical protein